MFVIKTFQQLEKAMGENALEIVIVGRRAAEILEAISQSVADENRHPEYPFLSRLNESFHMLEVVESNQKVAGILHQKPMS